MIRATDKRKVSQEAAASAKFLILSVASLRGTRKNRLIEFQLTQNFLMCNFTQVTEGEKKRIN